MDQGKTPEGEKRCEWCRRPVPASEGGPGRPRKYCKRSCRQRDFESRQKAASHGLDEQEILVARSELNKLRDDLYVLACAAEDARRDLVDAETGADYRAIVEWLLSAADPLLASSTMRP